VGDAHNCSRARLEAIESILAITPGAMHGLPAPIARCSGHGRVVPTLLWNVAPGWWVLADTNATIDWK